MKMLEKQDRCPECGAVGYSRSTKTPEWRCRNKSCRYEWDVVTGDRTSVSNIPIATSRAKRQGDGYITLLFHWANLENNSVEDEEDYKLSEPEDEGDVKAVVREDGCLVISEPATLTSDFGPFAVTMQLEPGDVIKVEHRSPNEYVFIRRIELGPSSRRTNERFSSSNTSDEQMSDTDSATDPIPNIHPIPGPMPYHRSFPENHKESAPSKFLDRFLWIGWILAIPVFIVLTQIVATLGALLVWFAIYTLPIYWLFKWLRGDGSTTNLDIPELTLRASKDILRGPRTSVPIRLDGASQRYIHRAVANDNHGENAPMFSMSLDSLGLSIRSQNSLSEAGLTRAEEVMKMTDTDVANCFIRAGASYSESEKSLIELRWSLLNATACELCGRVTCVIGMDKYGDFAEYFLMAEKRVLACINYPDCPNIKRI